MTWLLIDPLCVYRLRKELNQALEEMEDIQRDLMKQVGSNQQFESQLLDATDKNKRLQTEVWMLASSKPNF